MQTEKQAIPKKSTDISDWYTKVILAAEMADYGPAKGTMIFRPYGYRIWELIQEKMDLLIKQRGVENAYFPLFIPEKLINKEKSHVDGFSPELAVVTIGGGHELEEPLVVRPTSETIMYDFYAKWIQSWRDLPVLINQWNNVVRWEKRTYLFMRTSEFLWQEGHTAHATHTEAREMMQWGIDLYEKVYREYLAMPGYLGKKSESEKFAGGDMTLTYETLMPDGKALQSCTSHDLGQNFAKAFGVTYQDKNGEEQYVWQTSWGLSTRSIGGLIMAHGDDHGLRLPPEIAPIQVIVVPVKSDSATLNHARKLADQLIADGVRAKVDTRDGETLGYKINKWELKGVPLRIELGPREIENDRLTLARRDNGEKQTLNKKEALAQISEILSDIQQSLYNDLTKHLEENTHEVQTYADFKEIMKNNRGFIRAYWDEDPTTEAKIKAETKATTRCLEKQETASGKCIYSGKPAQNKWLFAQAY